VPSKNLEELYRFEVDILAEGYGRDAKEIN